MNNEKRIELLRDVNKSQTLEIEYLKKQINDLKINPNDLDKIKSLINELNLKINEFNSIVKELKSYKNQYINLISDFKKIRDNIKSKSFVIPKYKSIIRKLISLFKIKEI